MENKLEIAQFYFDIGEKRKAYEAYQELIRVNQNIPEAWYGIARCIDDIERKEYCLQRAIKLKPDYASALSLLQWCEDEKSRREKSNISKEKSLSPTGKLEGNSEKIGISNQQVHNPSINQQTASINQVTKKTGNKTKTENSNEKKSGKIVQIILGIILIIFGILLISRIISNRNINIQNSNLYSEFTREASKLDIMTGQGVNNTDFGNQLAEVKTAYLGIQHTSAVSDYQKREFDKAIYGWDLALEAWDYSLEKKLDSTIGWESEYAHTLEKFLEIDSILAGYDLVEGYKPVISLLLTKASEHYNAGVKANN